MGWALPIWTLGTFPLAQPPLGFGDPGRVSVMGTPGRDVLLYLPGECNGGRKACLMSSRGDAVCGMRDFPRWPVCTGSWKSCMFPLLFPIFSEPWPDRPGNPLEKKVHRSVHLANEATKRRHVPLPSLVERLILQAPLEAPKKRQMACPLPMKKFIIIGAKQHFWINTVWLYIHAWPFPVDLAASAGLKVG